MKEIQERLFALQDIQYKEFQQPLMPTLKPETMIGVRIPELRKMAKELAKEPWIHDFLRELPHTYFEEMCIHGFILEQSKEYEPLIEGVDAWLPYVDNWAACDMVNPKLFKKRPDGLLLQIRKWMADSHPYTVRFGIGMLMRYYLDDFFQEEYLEWAAGISSKE